MNEIIDVLQPETPQEHKIINDADFQTGIMWGKVRNGHPEGKVLYHVKEVLDNIDKYAPINLRSDLRLIALIHDTFKYKVTGETPRTGENNHATIARRFAEKYIDKTAILDIIQLHDSAYNIWSKANRKNDWSKANAELISLLEVLGDNVELYHIFYKCDNLTGNKSQECFTWFENNL